MAARDGYVKALNMLHEIRLVTAVSLGVLVWDLLSAFSLECKFVFRPMRKKFTFTSFAYLVTRYFALVKLAVDLYIFYWPHRTDAETCDKVIKWNFYSLAVFYLFANYLFAARVYSLWERNQIVLGALVIPAAAVFVLQCVVPSDVKSRLLPPGLHACVPYRTASKFWITIFAALMFDLFVLVLALYKEIQLWRQGLQSNIMVVLLRDQILFFAVCAAANLANMIFFAVTDPSQNRALLFSVAIGMTSISACRMVLNLRESAENPYPVTSFVAQMPFSPTRSEKLPPTPASYRPTFTRSQLSSHQADTPKSPRSPKKSGLQFSEGISVCQETAIEVDDGDMLDLHRHKPRHGRH